MKTQRFSWSLFLLLVCACSTGVGVVDSDPTSVWVVQHFHNGDGGNMTGSDPPDTAQLLDAAGVSATSVSVEELARCMGPGCPTYSAHHFALIPAGFLEQAQKAGFELSDGPSE